MRNDIISRSLLVKKVVGVFLVSLGITHYFVTEKPFSNSQDISGAVLEKAPSSLDLEEPVNWKYQSSLEELEGEAKEQEFDAIATDSLALEEEIESEYRQALKHIYQRENNEAATLLSNIVAKQPLHHPARAELAMLYLNEDQQSKAEKLLNAGLELDKENSDFLRLQAMLKGENELPKKSIVIGKVQERIPVKTFAPTASIREKINTMPEPKKKEKARGEVSETPKNNLERENTKKSGLEIDPIKSFDVKSTEELKEGSVSAGSTERSPKLILQEKIDEDYRMALQHIQNKEFVQAEILLSNNLVKLPSHQASRVELATLYLNNEQVAPAEKEILEGLKMDENHPDLLRLMAMVYDKKEDPEKALSLLVRVKGSEKQDKSYISFLGYIYQQTGRYALARQQYYRLLEIEPQNPLWLLGVSVALDGEGQKSEALEGYRKLKDSDIDANVMHFVYDRIKVLGG